MMPTIHCVVVEVPVQQDARCEKPVAHDLLPWADPYIARLIVKHQLQVAREDRARSHAGMALANDRFRPLRRPR